MNQNPSLSDVLSVIATKTREKEEAWAIFDARNKELTKLEILASGLQQFAEGFGSSDGAPQKPVADTPGIIQAAPRRPSEVGKTTRELIRAYLTHTPTLWRTTDDVRHNVSEMKGVDVPMGTIGPTLSNMKNDGEVVRDGNKVALADRVRQETPDFFNTNEAPSADAPEPQ